MKPSSARSQDTGEHRPDLHVIKTPGQVDKKRKEVLADSGYERKYCYIGVGTFESGRHTATDAKGRKIEHTELTPYRDLFGVPPYFEEGTDDSFELTKAWEVKDEAAQDILMRKFGGYLKEDERRNVQFFYFVKMVDGANDAIEMWVPKKGVQEVEEIGEETRKSVGEVFGGEGLS